MSKVRLSREEWKALKEIAYTASTIESATDPDNSDLLVDDQLADMYAGAKYIQETLFLVFDIMDDENPIPEE